MKVFIPNSNKENQEKEKQVTSTENIVPKTTVDVTKPSVFRISHSKGCGCGCNS